jgi:hypothetical protein
MFFYGFYAVLGAGGRKPAACTKQWGQQPLIELDQAQEYPANKSVNESHYLPQFLYSLYPKQQSAS